ncbi:MAG: YigZ family protein [Gracilibacteraceae bacterium]|nr:YigZ family protein [Gracilibacteraceae bacterium]
MPRALLREARAEQTIDKSRFIARLTPVADQASAEAGLRETRLLWPDARHYVYAWRLGAGEREKCSDDGEPRGTGGRPLLNLLQRAELWDALAVVTRYFGGVLLGTGGLTRAYAGTAQLALAQAETVLLRPHILYTLDLPYTSYEKTKRFLTALDAIIEKEEFAAGVTVAFALPAEKADAWEKQAAEWGGWAKSARGEEVMK